MTHEYNNQVARHYAVFRPDLYAVILSRLILPGERFKIGLDVGCCTGCSPVALPKYRSSILGHSGALRIAFEGKLGLHLGFLCPNQFL